MEVLRYYHGLLAEVDPFLFTLAFALVVSGMVLGSFSHRRNIRLLTVYPLWLLRKIEALFLENRSFWRLLGLIFGLNSLSLLLNVLSGLGVVLPYFFALLLGVNLGVIVSEISGGRVFLPVILNPVAWIELPAASLSLEIGMMIGRRLGVPPPGRSSRVGSGVVFFNRNPSFINSWIVGVDADNMGAARWNMRRYSGN